MKQLSNLSSLFRFIVTNTLLIGALTAIPNHVDAAPRRIGGDNAIAGGFGFQVGLADWSPGGFKWFNEYLRNLSKHVWLDIQFNLTTGDMDDRHCWYDGRLDRWRCTDGRWDGIALEFAVGPNLRFEMRKIPLVIDAKLTGAFETLFFGHDYAGVALAFRGGVGVHYFLFEDFGVGPGFLFTMGPAFISDDEVGVEFFGTIDFQIIGCEYRF